MPTTKNNTYSDPFMGHGGRKLSKRHNPDPKSWEMNKKEFRFYESLDMLTPIIL